ncbi:MAG: S8 family serine peptidase [Thermoanaerobaculia bacterium]
MKKLLAFLITLSVAAPLLAQSKTRYLISMRTPAGKSALRIVSDAAGAGAHDVRTFSNLDFFAADLTEAEAAALQKSSDVRYLSPVVERTVEVIDMPRLQPGSQARSSHIQTVPYGIDLVHARDVWPLTRGKGTVNVVVVDTGIDYTHPDLQAAYAGGYNVFTKTNDPKDDHGHGTHVAGIIAAADNDFGVAGVAPEVRLWSVKVLQANGQGTDETVMAGLDWVISRKHESGGNWIVNLSLGATSSSPAERTAFARAIDENILVVAAAGNHGFAVLDYPAGYDRVVAVSAIGADSRMADFSSYGVGTVFAAPGVDVLSSVPVGSVEVGEVFTDPNTTFNNVYPLTGAAMGEVTAETVYCGYGKTTEIPAEVKGKIALIRRYGPNNEQIYFRDKAKNALAAGAAGVVIVPPDEAPNRVGWTLYAEPGDTSFQFPITVSVNPQDGANLIANAGKQTITISHSTDDYGRLSGTSMATPHVAGVAALVWSLAPDASAEQIRLALKLSAFDLGTRGYDAQFGYGRIDALAGAKYVDPAAYGLPPTKPPVPTRRRSSSPHR